jgi:hypothetical protein
MRRHFDAVCKGCGGNLPQSGPTSIHAIGATEIGSVGNDVICASYDLI